MAPSPDYVVASGSLPPTMPIISKVGAGNSMVAGITLSLARGKPLKEPVLFGVAAGTILWILFPALCIHHFQVHTGAIEAVKAKTASLSQDPRIIALLSTDFSQKEDHG